jgi:uncharacterized protein YdaL
MRFNISIIVVSFLLAGGAAAEPTDYPLKEVLILYDQRVEDGAVADLPNALENLLGHFHTECSQLPDKRYRKGKIEEYDTVFYIKAGDAKVPKSLLKDIINTDRTVCWMGKGLGEVARKWKSSGYKVSGTYDYLVNIEFRGETYPCELFKTPYIKADEIWTVEAAATDGNAYIPIIMRRSNFWAVNNMAFFEIEGLVFAELLHDIMDEDHPPETFAYLRLEDINPTYDTDRLRRVADFLYEQKVPYMVGVIPAFTDPKNNRRVYISEVSEFGESIRYMQERGGIPILHGYTHQASKKEKSGEGYEFWDGDRDAPLGDDDVDVYSDVIVTSLEECLANGIYPLAWESPHYASSEAGYLATALHFTVAVEALQLSDRTYTSTLEAPYVIWNDRFGRTTIAGNCGYVYGDYEETAKATIDAAERLKIVRDPTALVFFHPFLDMEHLETIVDGFERAGYAFADIRNMPCEVNAGSTVYRTGPGPLTLDAGGDYVRTFYLTDDFETREDRFGSERVKGLYTDYSKAGPKEIYVAERWASPSARRFVGEREASWFLIGEIFDITLERASNNVMLTLIWAFAVLVSGFLIYLVMNYVTRAIRPRRS